MRVFEEYLIEEKLISPYFISVIIPNYNHATYLKQRIDSVLTQSYQNFEVIILDDASTDGSREVIESYRGHKKISHIVYNEKNSGSPFKQWQKGIGLSSGEYIWIAESDDYCEPEFLEKLIQPFKAFKGLRLSYCQSWIVDSSGKVLRDNKQWTNSIDSERWSKEFHNKGREEVERYMLYKNCIPNASAVLLKKDPLSDFFDYPYDWYYLGDWFFWVNLLRTGSIYFNPEKLNYFRTHDKSTRIHNTRRKVQKRVEEEYQLISYIKEHFDIKDGYIEQANYLILERLLKRYGNGFFYKMRINGLNKIVSHYDNKASQHRRLILINRLKHFIKSKLL